MKNYDKKFLEQAIGIFEAIEQDMINEEIQIPYWLREEVKSFLVSYQQYQCQKDEKMHGDL